MPCGPAATASPLSDECDGLVVYKWLPLVFAMPHDQSQVQRIIEVCHRADCSVRRWHVGSNAVAEIIAASLIPPGLEMRRRPATRAVEADDTSEEVASASPSRKEHSFY